MWQMSRGHKLHQYSKTLHKTKVIAATGSHWFYSLLRKKSVNPHNTKNMFCLDCALIQGDMASDLYGPQFWDDNFQFSFSVVVSCKSNKQLGYF